MNAIQKKLIKLEACEEGVEKAGRYRTAKQAWHGWQNGEDLVWLLKCIWLPVERLKAVLDAMVRQAWLWADEADAADRAAFWARAAGMARERWEETGVACAAAETAEAAGVMTCDEAQAVLADMVRREVPWEEVREFWRKETGK